MAYETIRYDVARDIGIATIALDQPETRNALSDQLLDELLDAFAAAKAEDGVRCVVLTSTHETVFSAGGSLDQFAADVPLVHKHFGTERFPQLFTLIMQLGSGIPLTPVGTDRFVGPGAQEYRFTGQPDGARELRLVAEGQRPQVLERLESFAPGAKELAAYATSKGGVQLPHDRPLPHGIIRKIVRFRLAENLARDAARAAKKAKPRAARPRPASTGSRATRNKAAK